MGPPHVTFLFEGFDVSPGRESVGAVEEHWFSKQCPAVTRTRGMINEEPQKALPSPDVVEVVVVVVGGGTGIGLQQRPSR